MKILFTTLLSAALIFSSQVVSQAETKKSNKPTSEAVDNSSGSQATNPAAALRPFPMYARVDSIDATNRTFVHRNKNGKVVKLVATDQTQIRNGDKTAAFEDIRVGDMISGLRLKRGADGSEYEIVKITKFGPKGAAPAE